MQGWAKNKIALTVLAVLLAAIAARRAWAIDFYEIQIYPVETTPPEKLELELHSNSVVSATGAEAKSQLVPYQIHETVEATYGLTDYVEVGQYFCTAKLDNGDYEYAGSRTKMHFGIPQTFEWPIRFGGNIELDYMRRAAEENPLSLELRPITEFTRGRFTLIGNFAFEKPFTGPGTHKGMTLAPSGEAQVQIVRQLSLALEYYGDMGALEHLPGVQRQQHFLVPAINLPVVDRLEFNFGVGMGVTAASHGVFIKSILGWEF